MLCEQRTKALVDSELAPLRWSRRALVNKLAVIAVVCAVWRAAVIVCVPASTHLVCFSGRISGSKYNAAPTTDRTAALARQPPAASGNLPLEEQGRGAPAQPSAAPLVQTQTSQSNSRHIPTSSVPTAAAAVSLPSPVAAVTTAVPLPVVADVPSMPVVVTTMATVSSPLPAPGASLAAAVVPLTTLTAGAPLAEQAARMPAVALQQPVVKVEKESVLRFDTWEDFLGARVHISGAGAQTGHAGCELSIRVFASHVCSLV